ncbi:MAG: Hsp70 family protein [Planctomycetes bacterium]|nr:Hsp70 family protein [Planctomycetota bacterium]
MSEYDMTIDDPLPSRFVVGLDLGTTNSAMAYVDTDETPRQIRTFSVPQIVAPGQIEARDTLPSFHYQPGTGEFPAGSMRLTWQNGDAGYVVGQFARDHGTQVPGRMIASAKSWLCHNGVDRTADLLPWQGAEDVERLSPVTVSARYLQHFREAWDARFPAHPLADQDFVLTLPASFDEVARELTIKAARQAGLNRVVLIEEPQAAFYAWIDKHSQTWDQLVSPGQKILVCDVGGGTSDFTLIRVRRGADGVVQFHRVAVGDHLILGGDNFDLTLAHHLEQRIKGDGHLEPRQWSVLVRSCRQLKEVLMAGEAPEKWTLTLPGSGARLIGGGLQVAVTRDEVRSLLVDGFFPLVPIDDRPRVSQSGFQEFGLPYAPDPAITRYLAAFLTAHRYVAIDDSSEQSHDAKSAGNVDPARPDIVLFNGGVFASPILQQRIITSLENWFRRDDPQWTPIVLENERLDLAVARGAAYYGMVRRGEGVRIAAGLARTYYIGVEAATDGTARALCLLPAGIEPGHEIDLTQHQFQLLVSQPIEFPLYVSSTRLTDKPGDLVVVDPEQIKSLPPIRTVLKTGKSKEASTVSIILKALLTEIGTLDLSCHDVSGKRSWKLLFDVRSATHTDIAAHDAVGERQGVFDDAVRQSALNVIQQTFAPAPTVTRSEATDPASLIKRLVEALGMNRDEWPTSLLRQLWESLLAVESGRRQSAQHEARWLNLTGFALRPGYGLAVDDWRVAETWKLLHGKLAFATPACRAESHILWRRIAGGLTAGQQQALATPLIGAVRQGLRQASGKGRGSDFGSNPHESAEVLRLLGSCELLSLPVKHELGELLLDILNRERFAVLQAAALWALGRVGARRLVYGPLNGVVAPDVVARWLIRLMKVSQSESLTAFAVMQLSRKTGDRYRDIDDSTRNSVEAWMDRAAAPKKYRQLVRDVGSLDSEVETLIFGEALPKGLRIL